MPLVKAIENGTGQTESLQKWKGDVELQTSLHRNSLTRSLLERSVEEGENPVGELENGDSRDLEYRASDIAREWVAFTSNPKYVLRPIAE